MKSEPPTPARAPDNRFRQMQDQLNYVRSTSLLNIWGWGRGFLTPSGTLSYADLRHACADWPPLPRACFSTHAACGNGGDTRHTRPLIRSGSPGQPGSPAARKPASPPACQAASQPGSLPACQPASAPCASASAGPKRAIRPTSSRWREGRRKECLNTACRPAFKVQSRKMGQAPGRFELSEGIL